MNFKKLKKNKKGVALLFTIVVVGIIFTMAIGILTISLKEINFTISGKSSNDAFFAADAGAECALYYDKSALANNFFRDLSISPTLNLSDMKCAGNPVKNFITNGSSYDKFNFSIFDLNDASGCANVTVLKYINPAEHEGLTTKINSKGYNRLNGSSCGSGNNIVERELEVTY